MKAAPAKQIKTRFCMWHKDDYSHSRVCKEKTEAGSIYCAEHRKLAMEKVLGK